MQKPVRRLHATCAQPLTGRLSGWVGFFFILLLGLSPALWAQTSSQSFTHTGSVQTFTVPAGVTTLTVVANGSRGGNDEGTPGGNGGRVTATLSVTPGQVLNLYVGGIPYNGGGNSVHGKGGGASDIRIGGIALENRVIVAGGGGGSSFTATGGAGGGLTAVVGARMGRAGGGLGGTQSQGGNSGSGEYASGSGALGLGGDGNLADGTPGGGGGGGGYYGGGGGNSYFDDMSGGGGGSSYTHPTLCSNVVHEQGVNSGTGRITLSWATQDSGNSTCDASVWTGQNAAAVNEWKSVAYGNGLFVAVAFDGDNRVMTSPNGTDWTAKTAPSKDWSSVTYGNGKFVAVSNDGAVMTSTNGTDWTLQTVAAAEGYNWTSVTYGNNLFVAVAQSKISPVSPLATPASNQASIQSVNADNQVMISSDGITWTAQTAPQNSWQSVTYGTVNGNPLFVAVSIDGPQGMPVMTSPNGIDWTLQTVPGGDDYWLSVTYGNGKFVAVSDDPAVMTSSDGINWTLSEFPNDYEWRTVTYGDGLFVAVANDPAVMTSPDGISWTNIESSFPNSYWNSVTYGNGLFVAVGGEYGSGSDDRVMIACYVRKTPAAPCTSLPDVTIAFPTSATVNPVGPVITVPVGQALTFQVFGGGSNARYERKIIIERINGFEIRTVLDNNTGVFPIDQAGPYTITVTDANGCSRTVTGVIQRR